MSASLPSLPENRAFRLLLIDEDPVFRLGLRVWLEPFPDLEVIAEAEDGSEALAQLRSHVVVPEGETLPVLMGIDGVVLDINVGRSHPDRLPGLTLCQQIRAEYPTLPILILSSFIEPVMLAAAQRAGATGYCPKQVGVSELLAALRQVVSGQAYWVREREVQSPVAINPATNRLADRPPSSPRPTPPISAFSLFRRNLRQSGIRQIDAALADVSAALETGDLALLDRAVLAGRYRELRSARWLVNRLLATPSLPSEPDAEPVYRAPIREEVGNRYRIEQPTSERQSQLEQAIDEPFALPSDITVIEPRRLQSVLFDAVSDKVENGLENETETPLETDILREEKKRELFYLILRKIEDLLSELRFSQVQVEQLDEKQPTLLRDLWKTVTSDFFGKYYTVPLNSQAVELVPVLLQDEAIVQEAILDKIPGISDLLRHLLFQVPLVIDATPYPPGNPAALARAELLLENWMIQLGNAVVQPLLNRFANLEVIKQTFYTRRLLSNRELERFRNDLSWRYRLERYVREPTDVFESQYRLFCLSWRGIKTTAIYAPRNQELQQLTGIPLAVTLALETRDAIAPRLRSVVSFVGNGMIYVLTEVLGRSIGLIGRGILKGLGNAWQDGRSSRR